MRPFGRNRRVFALILAACLLGSALSGCGFSGEPEVIYDEEPSAQPQMSFEEQKQVLEREYDCWAFADPYDCPWYYTFTDLDHNGQLEVLAASTQGTGIFTYARYYELQPDGTTKRAVKLKMQFVVDERAADGLAYAVGFRKIRYYITHPEMLLTPPEKIEFDKIDREKKKKK